MPTFGPGAHTYTTATPVTVELYGAGGGNGDGENSNPGGSGGYVSIEVDSGVTLEIAVGEGGATPTAGTSPAGDGGDGGSTSYGETGGGGGGATTVTRQSDAVELAAAGAGGGGGAEIDAGLSNANAGGGGGARGGQGASGNDSDSDGGDDAEGTGVGGDGDGGGGYGYSGEDGGTLTDGGVTVNATQKGGGSNPEQDGQVQVIIPPPETPTDVSQTVTGDDVVDVSWDDISTASEYDVQVQEDGGAWQTVTTTGQTSITYGATPSTNTHRFRVRSVNDGGTSDWAYTDTKATDPSGLTASGDAFAPIALSWDGVPDASEYRVLRSTTSGSGTGDYTEIGRTGATTYDDDAAPLETFHYRIQAIYSGTDSQLSNEASALRWEPPIIDAFDVSTQREVGVSWSLQDDSPDGSVEIYRSTDGSLGSVVGTIADPATTSWVDAGVADGTEYHYTLRRVVGGQSADSGQESVTTILPANTGLTVDDVRDTEADLSWTTNTADAGEQRVYVKRWSENGTDRQLTGSEYGQSVTGSSMPAKAMPRLTGDLTIVLDIYFNSQYNRQNAFHKAYGGAFGMTLEPAGNISFYWGPGNGDNSPYSTAKPQTEHAPGNRYRIVIRRDNGGQAVDCWQNGSSVSVNQPDTWEAPGTSGETALHVGDGYTNSFDGIVYEATAIGGLLSDTEALNVSDGAPTPLADAVAHYPMDMLSGGLYPDLSKYANDLTTVGDATLTGPTVEDNSGALAGGAESYTADGLLNGERYEAYVHAITGDNEVRTR